MFIKKFYDTAVDEGGGGSDTVVAETLQENLSPAASLAKFGQKSDENGITPINIPEKKEVEKPVVEEKTTAKVEETKPTEKPASEPPQEVKKEEQKSVEKSPIAEQPQKVQTLDEVLKNNQPDTVLKALGFDDQTTALIAELKEADPKLVAIMQAYKKGELGNYINALGTDYTKMTDVDVMRHQLRKEYPKVSDAAFEALFEDEVLDKYKLDSDTYTDTEVAKGKLLLEAKAARYRDELMTNQEKYLMPGKPEPKAEIAPDNSAELKAKENIENYVKEISNDPYTKDIFANKKITIGEGNEKFTYPVDPDNLIANLSDAKKWVSTMFESETGAPKTQHQMLVSTVAEHGMDFLNAYALHFKGLGGKEVIEPIDNASEPNKGKSSKSEAEPTTGAGQLAKHGKRSDGSN